MKSISQALSIQIKSTELCLLLSIPASIGLIIASDEITNALFGYGSFSKTDVQITSLALKYFGYGVSGFALVKVLSNFFFARDNTKTPFYVSLFNVSLNISISLIFFSSVGFLIIPIATSIAAWSTVLIYLILLKKNNYINADFFFNKNYVKICLATFIMALALYFSINFFEDKLIYSNYYKSFYLIILVILSAIIYLISTKLLGVLKFKNFKTS